MRTTTRLEVDGAALAAEHEPAGEGAPVVFLHAGIADRSMWDGVVDHLAGRPWVRYDLRGFGESTLPDGPYQPHGDVIGVLDALGIERAVVCGVSFGGAVAIDTAIAAPERVAALIAVATGPFGRERDAALVAEMEAADQAADDGDLERALELELRIWVDGPQRAPDELDAALRERARAMNRAAWNAGMGGEPEVLEPLAVARLGEITAPTLVIDGELDQAATHAGCRQVADEVPNARLVVMPGVAHLPPLEQPEAFTGHVADFLARVGV
jgi:pimeloyl-ACP methyl ester carboxylesterase